MKYALRNQSMGSNIKDGNYWIKILLLKIKSSIDITVLASTAVDLYFLHYFHLDSSEVVQLVQFKFKIL